MEKRKMTVTARWTGSYPCLCCGTWILKVNGKNVSEKIPDELRHEPMGTYGTYSYWYFAGWEEKFKEYQDGMKCERWVEANKAGWTQSVQTLQSREKSMQRFRRTTSGSDSVEDVSDD